MAEKLQAVYENPRTGLFADAKTLAKRGGVTKREAIAFLNSQETHRY